MSVPTKIINCDKIDLAKKIREFEFAAIMEHKAGNIGGSIHCCIGQELDEVEIIDQLFDGDIVFSNHRSHGHYLAFTQDFDNMMEIIKTPPGAQHLYDPRGFYANGVQGGLTPIACGMAFAEKENESNKIVVCFIGDGTLGQGIVYESLNIAALWGLPIVYVVENNQYAMSTSVKNNVSLSLVHHSEKTSINRSIRDRFSAFGLEDFSEDRKIHRERLPGFIVIDTYRFCGHSGSDTRQYRTREEENEWKSKDRLGGYLLE